MAHPYRFATSARFTSGRLANGSAVKFYSDRTKATPITTWDSSDVEIALGTAYTIPATGLVEVWAAENEVYVASAVAGSTPYPMVSVMAVSTPARGAFVNVMDYGAEGDGNGVEATPTGTDDSAAITAAILAAHTAGGGTVYFPPGIYRCLSKISYTDGVSVLGCGPSLSWVWGRNRVCGHQNIDHIKLGAWGSCTGHDPGVTTGVHFLDVQFRGGGGDSEDWTEWRDRYVLQLGGYGASFLDGVFRDCKIERNLDTEQHGVEDGSPMRDNVLISAYNHSGSGSADVGATFDNCVFGVHNGVASGANAWEAFNIECGYSLGDGAVDHSYDLIFQKCVFEASDGTSLSFVGSGGPRPMTLAGGGYNQQAKRLIFDGCLIKGAGKVVASGQRGDGIHLEGPYQAFIGGGTRILTCRTSGIAMRSTSYPYGVQASVIDGVEFDFTRNDEGIAANDPNFGMVYIADAVGATIANCTMKTDTAGGGTRTFFQIKGYPAAPGIDLTPRLARDIQIRGNSCYDLSVPSDDDSTGARFLRTEYASDVTVENNKVYTRHKGAGSFVYATVGTKRVLLRNNEIHSLVGMNHAGVSIGDGPLQTAYGAHLIKDSITAQFTALAVSEELRAAADPGSAWAKTASTTEHLSAASYDDTQLVVTVAAALGIDEVFQDAAAPTELVKVISFDGATLTVERGYAGSALVEHLSGATWNMIAYVSQVPQPTHARNVTVTGGQAGQTAKVGILGRTGYGGTCVEWIAMDGTNEVPGIYAFSYIDEAVVPVRQAAGDTVAMGTGALVGLPGVIENDTDVLEVSRRVSAGTSYAVEATGTVNQLYQTIDLGSITAGDSIQIKAKVVT